MATKGEEIDGKSESVVPLCVDLDGTLIRSDLLMESSLALLKQQPLYLLAFPIWLLRGRARFKREIARRVSVNVATLPYDRRALALLKREAGRPLILCTACDQLAAKAVARHLGGFDQVLGSDGAHNLAGRHKAERLVGLFGERGFDYVGNEARDLAIWRRARGGIVVNASAAVAEKAARVCEVGDVLPREHETIGSWLKALRPYQWFKNLLVFVPLLAAHKLGEPAATVHAIAAFAIFCACASGVYVINDLLDLDADRAHPRKRRRPFASGRLSLGAGVIGALVLAAGAIVAAYALSPRLLAVIVGYYLLTLAYSLKLKQLVMVDVVVLAGLYTSRIIAGTVAIGIEHSFWLLVFSMFLFLSLALVKRYTEVGLQRDNAGSRISGRGYHAGDYELLAALGGASGYISVLVLALYINSEASAALYGRPEVLWVLCPLLLYWVSRMWIVAHRGAMHDDPVLFAIRDRASQIVLALAAITVIAAIP